MNELKFHPDVAIDIKESYRWYEKQSIGLGEDFLDEIENSYQAIIDFPNTWVPFSYGFSSLFEPSENISNPFKSFI